MVTLYLTNS